MEENSTVIDVTEVIRKGICLLVDLKWLLLVNDNKYGTKLFNFENTQQEEEKYG